MKKIFCFFILILFVFFASYVKADLIFYEDFNDEDLNESHMWKINNNEYYFIDGILNSDGKRIDSSDRYLNQFDYFFNFSGQNLSFSFEGLLKSQGNPQEGRGIILSIIGDKGRYDLRIQDGFTSSFNINKHSLSFGYGTNSVYDYIVTNFSPERDRFYNLKAQRINDVWYFYVDDILIGTHFDTLNNTKFYQVHIPTVGSVALDNMTIVIFDELEKNISKLNNTEINQTIEDQDIQDLLKYAPVLYLHPNEYYEPKEIEAMLNNSFLKNKYSIIKESPIIYDDIENLTSNYYLDLQNVNIEEEDLPPISDFENFKTTIYGRIVETNGHKHYQYFIFYPFQKRSLMSHEGDWEFIQVNENHAGRIESVFYNFDFLTLVYYDLELLEFVNNTHPVVLVSLGSHNNFASNNEINFQNPYMYFQKFLVDLYKYEKVSKEGLIYKPKILGLENERERHYDIKKIYDIPYNFKGYWGEKTHLVLKQPPKSPKYEPKLMNFWDEPENWAYNPDYPFIGVFLFSPVDYYLFDNKKGNFINLTSEELLYKNEEKVSIVKGKDFNINIYGEGNGSFSLKIYLYDNETDQGIMVFYKNISTLGCSNGNLTANFNSDFVLEYDTDCDNKYEIFFPSENITHNFEYILPDIDEDYVIDYLDNCPESYNPEQEDFNNDGKGDVCDNPRYYKLKALEILDNLVSDDNFSKDYEIKIKLAKKAIKESLKEELWKNDFEVKTIKVFLNELYALNHLCNKKYEICNEIYSEKLLDVEYYLTYADKLIIEKLFFENKIDVKSKKLKEYLSYLYNKGITYIENKEWRKAILTFMHMWSLVN